MFQGAVGGILMRFYRHFTESKMARARFLRWVGGFAVLFLLICPGPAQAACTSPAGNAGDIIWSSSSNSPAYCNNTNWIGFPKGSSTFQGAVVDAGDAHTCGLLNGALYCWGNNVNGRTGLGTTTGEQLVPAQVGVATDWTRVSAGATHSCGIRAGALYCWGSNANARTGLGTISGEQLTPAQVGSSTGWTAIGAEGATHSCGIDAGAMYCWGSNVSGRTGLGLTTSNTTAPTQVGGATDWTVVSTGGSAASAHSCGIRAGALYCWGANTNGRTGLGTTTGNQTTPAQVGVATDWTRVSAGSAHTCGIRGGALYCWGWNSTSRTGLGTSSGNQTTPAQVGTDTTWTAVSAGDRFGCGLNAGVLYCWGNNSAGEAGFPASGGEYTTPAQVMVDSDWASVDAGTSHGCGFRGGLLYCWGDNTSGRTGQNVNTGSLPGPTAVPGAGGGCLSPLGAKGDIVYNVTSHVLQYCDGHAWYAAGSPGNGGAGCTSPTGAEGAVTYNTTHNVLQYCEGDVWMAVGDFVPPTCGGVVVGTYCWYYGGDNQSCNTVCASRGGCNAAGISYAAGSTANCTAVLDAIGAPGGAYYFQGYGALNIGCSYATGNGRVRDTSNTCGDALAASLRACACNN